MGEYTGKRVKFHDKDGELIGEYNPINPKSYDETRDALNKAAKDGRITNTRKLALMNTLDIRANRSADPLGLFGSGDLEIIHQIMDGPQGQRLFNNIQRSRETVEYWVEFERIQHANKQRATYGKALKLLDAQREAIRGNYEQIRSLGDRLKEAA